MHEAGVPAGVFNLVNGDGPTVGEAMSTHPDIDMMSFTGSTRAGIQVAKAAADTVKRVAQELGGKSANIVLEDADFGKAVSPRLSSLFTNSGQSCNAPTRMFVPAQAAGRGGVVAKAAAEKAKVGDRYARQHGSGRRAKRSSTRSRASSRRASTKARRWWPAASAGRKV